MGIVEAQVSDGNLHIQVNDPGIVGIVSRLGQGVGSMLVSRAMLASYLPGLPG